MIDDRVTVPKIRPVTVTQTRTVTRKPRVDRSTKEMEETIVCNRWKDLAGESLSILIPAR